MGKTKPRNVKRAAHTLLDRGVEFTTDFEKNKEIVTHLVTSKKLRNQIAGYLARFKKKEIKQSFDKEA